MSYSRVLGELIVKNSDSHMCLNKLKYPRALPALKGKANGLNNMNHSLDNQSSKFLRFRSVYGTKCATIYVYYCAISLVSLSIKVFDLYSHLHHHWDNSFLSLRHFSQTKSTILQFLIQHALAS